MKHIHPELLSFSDYFDSKKNELEQEFARFISFPTISSDPKYVSKCDQCARWLQKKLTHMGFTTSLWGDNIPPTVFGYIQGDSSKPTLLIYNHYDVQPVDPLEKWKSDPFTATLKGDKIIARGAVDNKGQAFYILTALSYFHEIKKGFPCSIKVLIEGEEESGSAHLPRLLKQHKNELHADYAMVVDLGMQAPHRPAITLGTRGMMAMTLELIGTKEDLHSGSHGGLAYNPLHALVELLARTRDTSGRITVPGFYDGTIAPSHELLNKLSWVFDAFEYEEMFGQPPTGGERDLHPLERVWLQPTLEINGITGGYGGEGCKTVIPSKAVAKISCRLVPGQNPAHISQCLKQFSEKHTPPGIHLKFTTHEGAGRAVRTNHSSPCIQALAKAMEEVFHIQPEYVFEGASIPIVPELVQTSSSEAVMWGLGLPSDKIHAPNEEFDWTRMKQGFLITCRLLQLLAS